MDPEQYKKQLDEVTSSLMETNSIGTLWQNTEKNLNFNVLSNHYRQMLKVAFFTGVAVHMETMCQIVDFIDSQDSPDKYKCDSLDAVKDCLMKEVEGFLEHNPIFNQVDPERN